MPVAISKLDDRGRELLTYYGLLECNQQDLVVVRCDWDRLGSVAVGGLVFTPGDTLLEYFYRRHWFNIFKVYDTHGNLKGWYCNLAEPVLVSGTHIRWRDLALDLVVLPGAQPTVLDEDEFKALAPTADLRRTAQEAFAVLRLWVRSSKPPFIPDTLPPLPATMNP